jgi:CubicO group peptidase (beta-lactamase class C family)
MKISVRSIVSAVLMAPFLFSPARASSPAGLNDAPLERLIDRYFESFPAYERFSGVVLLARGDRIFLHKGYGQASLEFGVANGPGARFQIGSITKAFTAMLVLKLAETGRLRLDAAISDYLPYYPEETGRRITLRQLLSHTSGIPHHIDAVPDYWTSHDKYFHTPKELLRLFWDVPLAHAPGERFTYSSPGFYILGAILEQAAKASYVELLRQNILIPLGMKDTGVENNRTAYPGTATGYMRGLSGLVRAGIEDKSTALAAGDIVSTAYNLYLWQKILDFKADGVLSAESKARLFEPIFPDRPMTWGGAVFKIPYDEGRKTMTLCQLEGSSAGYAAHLAHSFEEGVCVIVLSNVQDADARRIGDDIGDIFLRRRLGIAVGPAAPATRDLPEAADVPAADIEKCLGFYKDGEDNFSAVVRDDGRLYLLRRGSDGFVQPALALTPQPPGSFRLGHHPEFNCEFAPAGKDGGLTLTARRGDRVFLEASRARPSNSDIAEYEGYYTSVELQRTFHFVRAEAGLTAEKFLGDADRPLFPLAKDLFAWERGFIEFKRDKDDSISGFKLATKDTDAYFGSLFVRIDPR